MRTGLPTIATSMLVAGTVLACSGPGTVGPGAGPPKGAAPAPPLQPGESVLVLPITIPYATLEASVGEKLPRVLVDSEVENGRNRMGIRIERPAEVRFGRAGGALRMEVPLDIQADMTRIKAAERREKRGRDAKPAATLTAGLTLDIRTTFVLDADWTLVPDVTVEPVWTEPAVLHLGPLDLDVTKKVEEKLAEGLAKAERDIEAKMAERSDLRPKVAQAWADLATPRESPDGKGWMVVEPTALHATAPVATDAGLALEVGVQGRFAFVSEEPPAREPPPLPPPTEPRGGGLALSLVAEISWDELQARSTERLAEESWPLEVDGVGSAGALEITGVTLYPSGEHLAVGLDYATQSDVWPTQGTLWLLAIPRLGDDRTVVLEDFDYAVESDDWTLAPVNAESLRDRIRQSVQGDLVFPYGDALDGAVGELNGRLAKVDTKGGSFSAHVADVEVRDVQLTDAGLAVRVTARGTGRMEVTALER